MHARSCRRRDTWQSGFRFCSNGALIEKLEHRLLLSTVSLSGSTLSVLAEQGEVNSIRITVVDNLVVVDDMDSEIVAGTGVTQEGSNRVSTALANVTDVFVDAGDLDDSVDASAIAINIVVIGGSGNDSIVSGSGDDKLSGRSGNDTLNAGSGADGLFGGRGNDSLDGGDGDDVLVGHRGNDTAVGGAGNDCASGRQGDDILNGGDGNDRLIGGPGNDGLAGMDGDDVLAGKSGEDTLSGGKGNDRLFGGAGPDIVLGNAGNDLVNGQGHGRDTLAGGEGLDRVIGLATEIDEAFVMSLDFMLMDSSVEAPLMGESGFPQLTADEVELLLERADVLSANNDGIFAVVDRGGHILGVRTESEVPTDDLNTLVFSIDGAVAKARTAAFFSNGDTENGTLAPLTSRLVRFISQSTVTQREVESNPNIVDPNSTLRGPGFVAPIGLGGHFPPGVNFTSHVDLFAIEHTNRDSILQPGADHIKGTDDDILLRGRFNIDQAFVVAGQEIDAPESYGRVSGLNVAAQSRGIATLPGGIPLFRDTSGDGNGDTLIGGIGVFFPGPDGFATHEQGFVPGIGQSAEQRTNASRVLEAEFIAFAAAGGSMSAEHDGAGGAKFGQLADAVGTSIAAVEDLDMPFGRLSLVGINLQVLGPIAGIAGVRQLLQFGGGLEIGVANNGTDQPVASDGTQFQSGRSVPQDWLVTPHDSPQIVDLGDDALTADDVRQIIEQGIAEAELVRAAVRLPVGSRTRMVLTVTDTAGEVLGLFRMQDATIFSIDVAVAKARNVAYYADSTAGVVQDEDRIDGIASGVAFSNRTFRYLAEPRFPSGVEGTQPGQFAILNHESIDTTTGENVGEPVAASSFDPAVDAENGTVLGFDAFFPNTNFHDEGDDGVEASSSTFNDGKSTQTANQNGIVFFPGSIPIYKNGVLVGGFGVSGDGVDQDDVVTFIGSAGFRPADDVTRADEVTVNGVRLPFIKFLRNPHG